MPRPPRCPAGTMSLQRPSAMYQAQISALVFGVSGFGALIAATASNEWKVTTRASSVITATWVYQGLWMNCAGNALGSFHCRPHFTIFKVEVKQMDSICTADLRGRPPPHRCCLTAGPVRTPEARFPSQPPSGTFCRTWNPDVGFGRSLRGRAPQLTQTWDLVRKGHGSLTVFRTHLPPVCRRPPLLLPPPPYNKNKLLKMSGPGCCGSVDGAWA
ncbi:claudin-10 isoform X2 [Artibeus jamaicensis]|uniref:claudin-10 isoform X2 n=1 Tax=Artibeus jamaicensis TaxID=9417 RepID=UPI00235A7D2D|nr:claudin-10 isoform X2 [Artibeus jamaicensis]